jgi:hypothetical protein
MSDMFNLLSANSGGDDEDTEDEERPSLAVTQTMTARKPNVKGTEKNKVSSKRGGKGGRGRGRPLAPEEVINDADPSSSGNQIGPVQLKTTLDTSGEQSISTDSMEVDGQAITQIVQAKTTSIHVDVHGDESTSTEKTNGVMDADGRLIEGPQIGRISVEDVDMSHHSLTDPRRKFRYELPCLYRS